MGLNEKIKKWVEFVRTVLPGGSFWELSAEDVDLGMVAKPVTVIYALERM